MARSGCNSAAFLFSRTRGVRTWHRPSSLEGAWSRPGTLYNLIFVTDFNPFRIITELWLFDFSGKTSGSYVTCLQKMKKITKTHFSASSSFLVGIITKLSIFKLLAKHRAIDAKIWKHTWTCLVSPWIILIFHLKFKQKKYSYEIQFISSFIVQMDNFHLEQLVR